ncbi:MAG: OmpH family outer membrane protein [Saprospiraceae bacterium]|nr:OmpH family outer membrane protein [Bacteroidia bacterium]MBT8229169.1 OmpH family outer membrane protein [Bacteroidia bacterium]NNF22139.1 OmpH family outer membrane protein [Saprospiraceae bacterium]
MKINQIKVLIFFAAFSLVAISMNAQKFGYLNSALLLSELPEVKAADSDLEAYQKQLVTSGESMVKTFEEKYQRYVQEANEGVLSQVQMQQKEAELGQEQQKIQQYEVEVQQKILQKREELYQPILDKVKVALEAIGNEQGYTMIFDASGGVLLHAKESEDVMPLVKAKLGL